MLNLRRYPHFQDEGYHLLIQGQLIYFTFNFFFYYYFLCHSRIELCKGKAYQGAQLGKKNSQDGSNSIEIIVDKR